MLPCISIGKLSGLSKIIIYVVHCLYKTVKLGLLELISNIWRDKYLLDELHIKPGYVSQRDPLVDRVTEYHPWFSYLLKLLLHFKKCGGFFLSLYFFFIQYLIN